MAAKIYDIHHHLFNKTIIASDIARIAVGLTKSINVSDSEDHKIDQTMGNLKEFLTRVGSQNYLDIYDVLHAGYTEHFESSQYQMVYTPLTFDLTFVDDDDLGNATGDEWIRRKKDWSIGVLRTFVAAAHLLLPNTSKIKWNQLLVDVDTLCEEIKKNTNNIIDNQNFATQVTDMEALVTKLGKDHVKPFYCIDPRQARKENNPVNFIDVLTDKILNGQFYGVKLYSPTGFSPTDPVLFAEGGVYQFCVDHDIPITSHNSDAGFGSFALQVKVNGDIYDEETNKIRPCNNEFVKFKYGVISVNAGRAISERAEKLNHPFLWRKVLDKYPTLRLNLAHFGGSGSLMDMVRYNLPKEINKIPNGLFNNWMNRIPPKYIDRIKAAYRHWVDKNQDYYELRKEDFYPDQDDSQDKINEKEGLRRKFWELLYDLGEINNWSMHQLKMIQSDKYPNFYVDLSAFTGGKVYNFNVPASLQVMRDSRYLSIRLAIKNETERKFFESSYTQEDQIKGEFKLWKLSKSIEYLDQLRLIVLFKNIGELDKELTQELDLIKSLVSEITTDSDLINYLNNNENFSILEELNYFKTKLYDQLEPRHKEKILYGSDFYFTQVFGPRHEQYVQDFKNVFDQEFFDIACKHSEKFLHIP